METDAPKAKPQAETPVEPFSEGAFLDHLVRFITTGDQVRFIILSHYLMINFAYKRPFGW